MQVYLRVLCPVHRLGNVPGDLHPFRIDHIGKLYVRVLGHESLEHLFLPLGRHALYVVLFDIALDQMGGHIVGPLLQHIEFGREDFRDIPADHMLHLLVRHGGHPALLVLLQDALVYPCDTGMGFLDCVLSDQGKMGIDPVGYARKARFVGDVYRYRPVEYPLRVKGGVYLLVFCEPVDVDAGGRRIEIRADKRLIPGYMETDLLLEIIPHLRNHLGIDPVVIADERDILHDKRFYRGVARSFPHAQKGAVHERAPVEPRAHRADDAPVEIVMSVPFEAIGRHAGIIDHGPDDLSHGARQGGPGVSHAETEGIAQPYFYGYLRLFRQRHEGLRKGHAKPVNIGPRDVFEMAPRRDAGLERRLDDFQIILEHLGPRFVELVEDMIIGDAREHARLFQAELLDKLQVVLVRPYPSRNLRITVSLFEAFRDRFLVFLGIEEKLRLAYHPVRPAQPVEKIENLLDLLYGERGPRLLAVPERRIRDKDLVRGVDRLDLVVEADPHHIGIGKDVPEKLGLFHVDKREPGALYRILEYKTLPLFRQLFPLFLLRHPQPQLAELPRFDRRRSAGQQAGALLRLGERDHVPYAVEAQEHHQDAVDPEGDAPVGRRAHLQRFEEKTELLDGLFFLDAEELEHLHLLVFLVYPDAAPADLHPVQHEVVRHRQHGLVVAAEFLDAAFRRRERVMAGHVPLLFRAVFKKREIDDPQESSLRPSSRGRTSPRDRGGISP